MDNKRYTSYSKYFKPKEKSNFFPEYLIYILDNKDEQKKKHVNYHAICNQK